MLERDMYFNKQSDYFENPRLEMLKYIPLDAQQILDVGCGAGSFGGVIKKRQDVEIWGVEANERSVDAARNILDKVIHIDIDKFFSSDVCNRFDCIVLNDVLEHLSDPWSVLKKIHPHLKDGGVIVASLPNIRYIEVLRSYLVNAEWNYADDGVLDRTHLRFFTKRSMVELFRSSGFKLSLIEGINSYPVGWKFKLLNWLVGNRFDDTKYRQFALVLMKSQLSL